MYSSYRMLKQFCALLHTSAFGTQSSTGVLSAAPSPHPSISLARADESLSFEPPVLAFSKKANQFSTHRSDSRGRVLRLNFINRAEPYTVIQKL